MLSHALDGTSFFNMSLYTRLARWEIYNDFQAFLAFYFICGLGRHKHADDGQLLSTA